MTVNVSALVNYTSQCSISLTSERAQVSHFRLIVPVVPVR